MLNIRGRALPVTPKALFGEENLNPGMFPLIPTVLYGVFGLGLRVGIFPLFFQQSLIGILALPIVIPTKDW